MKKNTRLLIITGLICFAVLASLIAVSPKSSNAAFVCSTNSDCGTNGFVGQQSCQANSLYQDYVTYTCNNPGGTFSSCTSSKSPQLVKTCDYNQKCQDGLWFIGCAPATNSTNTNNTNYNNLRCVGNSVYWFDFYGNQQGKYQDCGYNQTCSNNSCVTSTQQSCNSHTIKGCVNNSVYWYNSCGTQQELYQSCNATNQTCQDGTCVGTYTPPAYTPPSYTATTAVSKENLIISIFGKKESDPLQWGKYFSALSGDKVNFLVTIKNISDKPIDNVSVKVDIADNIKYANNLKIDNLASSENIVSGINLGTISQSMSKAVSFDGFVESQSVQSGVKITGTVSSGKISDSDFFTINIEPAKAQANVSAASLGDSPITNLFKKWYIWAAIIIALVALFIVIFRRLSSNV